MLSSADNGGNEQLKAAFVPLNGTFSLNLVHSAKQLAAIPDNSIRVFIFAGSGDLTSWQENARMVRNANENPYFILISDDETMVSALTQGADLLVRSSEAEHLPLILGALLKRQSESGNKTDKKETTPETPASEKIDELRLKNSELEKINYELDRFVYSASHDLRAPLTSVLGLLDLLRNDTPAGEHQRLIDLMEESILKLDTTIRDIVAYSRNNRTEVNIEPVRIQPVVDEILREIKYLESGDVVLSECVKAEDEGLFLADKARLTTILKNLISNAIRYRHPARRPEVIVKVHRNAEMLDVTVADNGLGINEQHLGKIFDMFYRTSNHSTGSGLGLYIVKETVKKLNGNIEVQSRVNQGSVFHISLPLIAENKQRFVLDE